MASPSLPPGTLLAGKFRIERLLGVGAMGAVYAIDHELTRHKRALKLLHPDVREVPDIVRRFLAEASAAGRAGSPHLVETFDAGTLPTGEPYVVMELLEGETLGAILERETRLGAAYAAELVAQAAEGIEAAHRAGIIHRDLKPENLFVTAREGRPFVKILDFGVSKFVTASSGQMRGTRAGLLYGSPSYMSPEQLSGATDIDARTDVFALGVVLYQCVTGVLPFDGPTIHALTIKVLTGEPTPIEQVRPDLPPSFVDAVRRALVRDREGRIATAMALAEALAPVRRPSLMPPSLTPPALDDAVAPTLASAQPSPRSTSVPPPMALPKERRSWVLVGLTIGAAAVAVAFALLRGAVWPTVRPQKSTAAAAAMNSQASVLSPAAPEGAPNGATTTLEIAPLPLPSLDPAIVHAPRMPSTSRVAPAATASAPASSASPAPSSVSGAQSLGLREDNPFR